MRLDKILNGKVNTSKKIEQILKRFVKNQSDLQRWFYQQINKT